MFFKFFFKVLTIVKDATFVEQLLCIIFSENDVAYDEIHNKVKVQNFYNKFYYFKAILFRAI